MVIVVHYNAFYYHRFRFGHLHEKIVHNTFADVPDDLTFPQCTINARLPLLEQKTLA